MQTFYAAYYLSVIQLKKTLFIKNAAILTVSGFLLKIIGVIFKVWLASNIGSEGIGLYQIVFSVFVFAGTFATSGISTAVTRICAEKNALGNRQKALDTLKKCILITLAVAFFSTAVLFFGANFISKKILSDARAVLPVKVLSFALPFMGICSCLRGYFFALRKATTPAISQIFEQLIRILVAFIAVQSTSGKGIGASCAAIMLGDTVAEICACLFLFAVFKSGKKAPLDSRKETDGKDDIYKKIKEIALPITLGRYLNSALRTAENILVPKLLCAYKKSVKTALSQFGMIKGMALPVVFFPSTLLNAVSLLLIPELSESLAKRKDYAVKMAVGEVISVTAVISYIFSAVFFVCGKDIGVLIYKSEEVGILIKLLSPIVPIMYLDSVCDGMLKGLNEQRFAFYTGVSDSALRLIAVFFVLPKFGIAGFVGIMYFSNFYTGFLNIFKLLSVSKAKFDFLKTVFIPATSAFCCVLVVSTAIKQFAFVTGYVYVFVLTLLSFAAYLVLLKKTACFDIRSIL